MYDHLDLLKMGSNPANDVWNEEFELAAATNSGDDDDLDFDLADILEDPFANLADLDLSIESDLCVKQAKSDLYLNRDVTNELFISEENLVEDSHNPLSFLDDLSQQISNVASIKEEVLVPEDQLDGGIATDEVNDLLSFLTTAKDDDNFADLDFLNNVNMQHAVAGESYAAGNFDEDDDLSNTEETKFNNCDPEPIKSDCMWSSTLSSIFGDATTSKESTHHHKGRKRDVSLTLSECAEGITSITSMEMTGFAPLEMLSTTPTVIGGGSMLEGALWNPLNTCNSETETDNSDEEVDVETPYEDVNPLLQHQHKSRHRKKSIEPGRSLLLPRNRSPPVQPASMYNHQTFIDHNYFMMPPPSPPKRPAVFENFKGVLTPTESSDDDEICNNAPSFLNVGSGNVDKRKIAQALQSLINNTVNDKPVSTNKRSSTTASLTSENVKFKFRMKFKSNSPQHSLLAVNKQHAAANNTNTKSVTNVLFPKSSRLESKNSTRSGKTLSSAVPATKARSPVSGPSRSNSSSNSNPGEKCREIRDLHNSMERQRRVDLRQNFDQLKAVVPELADSEKASKLNILNKASNYCRLLSTLDERLTNEQKLESAKNVLLRKKLLCLQKSLKRNPKF